MEKIYSKKEKLYFYDCDFKKRAKLSTINKFFAEIAGEAFGANGMTHQWLWEHGYAFLLSKMSIAFKRFPKADETVNVSTWERGTKGASFLRDFEIFDTEKNLICSAHSEWILINPQTRQIIRPSAFEGEQNVLAEKISDAPDCKRLKLTDAEIVDKRKIRYSEIDANGHVYNAFYADFAVDALPSHIIEKDILFYQINFINEAKLSEEMSIFIKEQEEIITVKGSIAEKDSFVCEIIYK